MTPSRIVALALVLAACGRGRRLRVWLCANRDLAKPPPHDGLDGSTLRVVLDAQSPAKVNWVSAQ